MNKFLEKYKDELLSWFDGLTEPQQRDVVCGMEHTLEEDESPKDYIESLDGDFLYNDFDAMLDSNCFSNYSWDKNSVIREILRSASESQCYSFSSEFIDDIVYNMEGYDDPAGFFKDLAYGGCQSGMVGMFIYNSDCKEFYINHIDDMEDMKRELEDEMGEPIRNINGLPHYTFICWLCYEEFARRIARELFPEDF